MKRELKAAIGATALLAGAATVVVVGGATSGSAAGTPSSAYGITASIAGNELLPPSPYVVSTDGQPVSSSLIEVPVPDLLNLGAVNAFAENNHATSSVATTSINGDILTTGALAPVGDALTPILDQVGSICDQLAAAVPLDQVASGLTDAVNQLGGALAPLTQPDNGGVLTNTELLSSLDPVCDTLDNLGELITIGAVTAECTGKTGTSKVGDISLLGLPVDLPLGINQALSDGALGALAPILDVKLNNQTTNADGTFSVTALSLDLLSAAGDPVVHLEVGHVTCGQVTNDVTPTEVPSAPQPTPIKMDVPVTG